VSEPQADGPAPVLRILTEDATDEEIAAVVAVFAAMGGAVEPPDAPVPSAWAHPSRQVRQTHRHGTGAWRASGLPH
jgi:hypothetical protein